MVDKYITEYYARKTEYGYDFVYSVDLNPQNDEEFMLHSHKDFYEIYLFLSGDVEFHIEGNICRAHPHDIFIARPYEMHHNVFLSSARYERIILFIDIDFFQRHHCEELQEFFLAGSLGQNCQIPASAANPELYQVLIKINHYLSEGAYRIAHGALLEFLYLLNHMEQPLAQLPAQDARISDIILYINNHISESLSLDLLSNLFFINKYHLCRIFKSITGYTVNHYINHKRLLLVHELTRNGQGLLEASMNAGFNSYAHFYKMHVKEFGVCPKKRLQQKVF